MRTALLAVLLLASSPALADDFLDRMNQDIDRKTEMLLQREDSDYARRVDNMRRDLDAQLERQRRDDESYAQQRRFLELEDQQRRLADQQRILRDQLCFQQGGC